MPTWLSCTRARVDPGSDQQGHGRLPNRATAWCCRLRSVRRGPVTRGASEQVTRGCAASGPDQQGSSRPHPQAGEFPKAAGAFSRQGVVLPPLFWTVCGTHGSGARGREAAARRSEGDEVSAARPHKAPVPTTANPTAWRPPSWSRARGAWGLPPPSLRSHAWCACWREPTSPLSWR